MNTKQLQDEILAMLKSAFEDKSSLERIHSFLKEEICKEPKENNIPSQYKTVVKEIAGSIQCGMICYFNPETLQIVENLDEYEMETGEAFDTAYSNWEKCIVVNPMDSHDSFQIMERFTEKVDDLRFQNQLYNILNNRRPFANFKQLIENSDYRQDWFDFRDQQTELYVWEMISEATEFHN